LSKVSDIDNSDGELVFTLISNSRESEIQLAIDEENNIDVIGLKPDWSGSSQISIKVSDDLEEAQTTFSLDVLPVNDPPVIGFSEPLMNAEISGTVQIRGSLSDIDNDLSELTIQLQIDEENLFDIQPTTQWTYSWNTLEYENGPYSILASAYDGITYSNPVYLNLTINNPIPQSPHITFISPSEGEEVNGDIAISGNLEDVDTPFNELEFQLKIGGGEAITITPVSLWTYSWDTTLLKNGPCMLSATASDGESTPFTKVVNVTINNPIPKPPKIFIESPLEGKEVSGIVNITGTATDPDGDPISISIKIGENEIWKGALNNDFWRFAWDTTEMENGPAILTFVAFDGVLFSQKEERTYYINNIEAPQDSGLTNGTDVPEESKPQTNGSGGDRRDPFLSDTLSIVLILIIAFVVIATVAGVIIMKKRRRETKSSVVSTLPVTETQAIQVTIQKPYQSRVITPPTVTPSKTISTPVSIPIPTAAPQPPQTSVQKIELLPAGPKSFDVEPPVEKAEGGKVENWDLKEEDIAKEEELIVGRNTGTEASESTATIELEPKTAANETVAVSSLKVDSGGGQKENIGEGESSQQEEIKEGQAELEIIKENIKPNVDGLFGRF